MSSLLAISVIVRLLATVWGVLLVWRTRDWRLAFLPVMMALLTLQPLLPRLRESTSVMAQLSVLTVVVTVMFFFLLRHSLKGWAAVLLKLMLAVTIIYEVAAITSDGAVIGAALVHSELSLSVVLYLSVVLLGRVLSERKLAEQRLRDQAIHDSLTGLPNRVLFMERLRYADARAKRRKDYLFALLFLDLDGFKLLNDSLGHPMGDLLLIQTAQRLKNCLRPEDIVARLGGDEFAILLEDLGESAEAERVAGRIHKQLAEPYQLEGHEMFITASIGIALSTTGYQRPEELLRNADTALYQAKAARKGHHEIFDHRMHEQVLGRLNVEADLRRALEHQQLVVHYQPIVALDSGKIVACEALMRWNHPNRGLICPAEFIPIAEETGLILPMGDWILQTACAQNKAWQQAGLPAALRMSVNVSIRQLYQRRFTSSVAKALRDTGLDPHFLELEVTESVLIENPEATSRALKELADLGVKITVDDFGTGYSSLSYLRRFPLHALKIDQFFVSSLSKGEAGSAEIIAALIMLARSLKLEVTAEGVESEDQAALLRSLKCARGQGFFFSRPMEPEAFTKFLQEQVSLSFHHPAPLQGADPAAVPHHEGELQKLARSLSEH